MPVIDRYSLQQPFIQRMTSHEQMNVLFSKRQLPQVSCSSKRWSCYWSKSRRPCSRLDVLFSLPFRFSGMLRNSDWFILAVVDISPTTFKFLPSSCTQHSYHLPVCYKAYIILMQSSWLLIARSFRRESSNVSKENVSR